MIAAANDDESLMMCPALLHVAGLVLRIWNSTRVIMKVKVKAVETKRMGHKQGGEMKRESKSDFSELKFSLNTVMPS